MFTWIYAGLWQKQGAGYVNIAERDGWADLMHMPIVGDTCLVKVPFTVPQDGDYKVVVDSAVGLAPMLAVYVSTGGPTSSP